MKTLLLIFGDQLNLKCAAIKACNPSETTVLMVESNEEATYIRHHKKKIAFIFSAMRHFAEEVKAQGFELIYTTCNDPENTGSFTTEIKRILKNNTFNKLMLTEPSEYRVLQMVKEWQKDLPIPVKIVEDDRFLCTKEEFQSWASGRKQCRMEFFYREMRKKHHILMQDNEPEGGKWNYDQENRKSPNQSLNVPPPFSNPLDSITKDVLIVVKELFNSHFGDLEPFYFAVTRQQALKALNVFIEERLIQFGDYQDAMVQGQPWMFHAHIGFYLNCGLLLPLECIQAVEKAYYDGKAPLNAVEGFIRQILGWREYIRGIYWLKMPEYKALNFLEATKTLPRFFWTGETKLNCLKQCITETKENAYAHHIQRLMVLGNFALLAGLDPKEVNEWYHIVYADAYEWVELPNVSGMVLYADGGFLASKPYIAGGAYIKRMSNYCKSCQYKVDQKEGATACPFNYLYWHFLMKHQEKLSSNPRLGMMYRSLGKMGNEKKEAILNSATLFLESI